MTMSKRIGIMIQNPEVWEEFKRFVVKKWGKKHTAMALELEEALKEYMAKRQNDTMVLHAHTHTEESSGNASAKKVGSRTLNNLKKVVACIIKETEKEIPQTTVEKIITETVGGDNRTLTRYNGMLLDYGIVKPVRPMFGVQKFIYEVNVPVAKSFLGGDVYEAITDRRIL
jgi:hypothetical protein